MAIEQATDATIEAGFFVNANTGLATELIIVASWEQRHYEVDGTLYGTFVYEHSTANGRFNAKFLKDISEKLDVVNVVGVTGQVRKQNLKQRRT